ncbi:Late transcription factor VLTF-4 [Deerpox virus W-1170-84]|uniref:Late transcription factor VLTF-4 n=1 Tax=Deerpox virus (strain W-1170-84) TaxID=305676 RepID=Q08F97_DPV84|nr:Late transcription factor VLTF-4 [Deerpox virus W-1170-84]AYC44656.1 late transcription factor VLTF-4 [Moosepox virus GoldyGopher14]
MSWSINLSSVGDNFKTLDEIRAHVKSTTESCDKNNEDIFPEDIEIPSPKQTKQKRTTTPRKTTTVKTKKDKKQLQEEKEEEKEDNEKTEENENIDEVFEEELIIEEEVTECEEKSEDTTEFSDLKLATETIIKMLKLLNTKVTAVSTVLEDAQAASVTRQYTSLLKTIENLKTLANNGKATVSRKKVKSAKK